MYANEGMNNSVLSCSFKIGMRRREEEHYEQEEAIHAFQPLKETCVKAIEGTALTIIQVRRSGNVAGSALRSLKSEFPCSVAQVFPSPAKSLAPLASLVAL